MRCFSKTLILILLGLIASMGCIQNGFSQKNLSNLSQKEAFLIKFKTIFKDIKAGESWNDYQTRLLNSSRVPGTLGPGARGRDALYLLYTKEMDKYDALREPEDIGIGYMLMYYPNEFKVKGKIFAQMDDFHRFEALNTLDEFQKRRLREEGKQKILEDVAKLKLPKRIYVNCFVQIQPYNFEKESFELRSNFSQFFKLKEDYTLFIPFPRQDFRKYKQSYTLPMKVDAAEKFRNELKFNATNRPRLQGKLWISIDDELRANPVYLDQGYSVHAIYYPWKYTLDSLEVFLYKGEQVDRKIAVYDQFESASKQRTSISQNNGRRTNRTSAASGKDFSFMRYHAGERSLKYVQYAGTAMNLPESIHQVGEIQLRLLYQTYESPDDRSLRPLPGNRLIGNIYFKLKDKRHLAWQRIDAHESLEDNKGYKVQLGVQDGTKAMTKVGYQNSYVDIIYQEDHSLIVNLYDKNGTLQFTSRLEPLAKNKKPPFTEF